MSFYPRLNLYIAIKKSLNKNDDIIDFLSTLIFNPLLKIETIIPIYLIITYITSQLSLKQIFVEFLFIEKKLIEHSYKSPFTKNENIFMNESLDMDDMDDMDDTIIQKFKNNLIEVIISGYYEITRDFISDNLKEKLQNIFSKYISIYDNNMKIKSINRNEISNDLLDVYNFCANKKTNPDIASLIFLDYLSLIDIDIGLDNQVYLNNKFENFKQFINSDIDYLLIKNKPNESFYRRKVSHEYITVEEYDSLVYKDKIYKLYTKIISIGYNG